MYLKFNKLSPNDTYSAIKSGVSSIRNNRKLFGSKDILSKRIDNIINNKSGKNVSANAFQLILKMSLEELNFFLSNTPYGKEYQSIRTDMLYLSAALTSKVLPFDESNAPYQYIKKSINKKLTASKVTNSVLPYIRGILSTLSIEDYFQANPNAKHSPHKSPLSSLIGSLVLRRRCNAIIKYTKMILQDKTSKDIYPNLDNECDLLDYNKKKNFHAIDQSDFDRLVNHKKKLESLLFKIRLQNILSQDRSAKKSRAWYLLYAGFIALIVTGTLIFLIFCYFLWPAVILGAIYVAYALIASFPFILLYTQRRSRCEYWRMQNLKIIG